MTNLCLKVGGEDHMRLLPKCMFEARRVMRKLWPPACGGGGRWSGKEGKILLLGKRGRPRPGGLHKAVKGIMYKLIKALNVEKCSLHRKKPVKSSWRTWGLAPGYEHSHAGISPQSANSKKTTNFILEVPVIQSKWILGKHKRTKSSEIINK